MEVYRESMPSRTNRKFSLKTANSTNYKRYCPGAAGGVGISANKVTVPVAFSEAAAASGGEKSDG
jgi:hypothetical protein